MKHVLLVEDDDLDAGLVEEAVKHHASALRLERAASADAAWDLLRARAAADRHGLPVCILLDMVMGEHDGIWLLEHLVDLPELRNIPVLVFSQRLDAVREARAFGNVVGAVEKPARDEDRRRLAGDLLRLAGGMRIAV